MKRMTKIIPVSQVLRPSTWCNSCSGAPFFRLWGEEWSEWFASTVKVFHLQLPRKPAASTGHEGSSAPQPSVRNPLGRSAQGQAPGSPRYSWKLLGRAPVCTQSLGLSLINKEKRSHFEFHRSYPMNCRMKGHFDAVDTDGSGEIDFEDQTWTLCQLVCKHKSKIV